MNVRSFPRGRGVGATVALALLLAPLVPSQRAEAPDPARTVFLKYAEFDPGAAEPAVPAMLRGAQDTNLWIVQFDGPPTEAGRAAVRAAGATLGGYLPENAYVVRMPTGVAAAVRGQPGVRWVGYYHPAYRLEGALRAELREPAIDVPARRYNLVVFDRRTDKPALGAALTALGGRVEHEQPGSILFEATLTREQLLLAARLDQVLWIDRWSPPEVDMDNARIQGGGNYVEAQAGYTGRGINGHVYEGIEANHRDFNIPGTPVLACGSADTHGHCTAGIIFGNGSSHPNARGMAPDARPFYTRYGCVNPGVSRWQVVQELVTNRDVMFTTASWGDARTTQYTSISADADSIVFDHDIPWTQSQSNAGNQMSRPQAWAKNIFSIGGVAHRDNADRKDDSWAGGGGSTGPAADGRIKPDLCAYYDSIWTSDLSGSSGYSSGDSYSGFGGTSGATPIVAGHNALAIQMFTDFIFNNSPRVPNGTRFQNRPHFTTLKALMIANARQYEFTASSSDNRREHCGWGFPDLRVMYDNRQRMFLVDETDVLVQGSLRRYRIQVLPGDPELKVAMTYADPPANPAASFTRINDLNLKVTDPSGVVYHGNAGLKLGNYSTPGGSPDARDTVECVFVSQPVAGVWTVEVSAPLIVQDSHVETPAVDADFGLCVAFGTTVGSITPYGAGCPGTGQQPSSCAGVNTAGGSLSNSSAPNEYAYEVSSNSALTVVAVEVFTRALSGTANVQAALYGAGPSTAPLATASLVAGSAPGFYRATFAAPVNVPAGTFYVGVDHTAGTTALADLTSGTPGRAYWRRPAGSGTWALSSVIQTPAVRVVCQGGGGGGAVPSFAVTGVPSTGETLALNLALAAPSTGAALIAGVSDQVFAGGSLPFDLGPFGAPGCSLLVSNEVTVGFTTNSQGGVSTQMTVPATSSLLGANVFEQFLVLDGQASVLGVAMSNAVRIVIGS